jgi:hypothetical protein
MSPVTPYRPVPATASEIPAIPIKTIWHGRLIVGALNLIAGEPGAGKSSLIALIAAELSRDGKTSILSNSEDDAAPVTIPRLLAADAVMERVHVITPDDAPVFPNEFDGLEYVIERTATQLVVLDPIGAHFSPEHRVHHRPTLKRLAGIARRTGCAIVGVHHTTKAGEIGGPNSGLRGTARAVYFYGFDPADEDRRALSVDKVNGISEPPTLLFEHEIAEVQVGRRTIEAGKLRRVRQSAAQAQIRRGRRDPERDAACHAWLSEFLAAGDDYERRSRDVYATGRSEGFGQPTLNRAKAELQVEHVRRGGYGADGWWVWRLPDDHPLRLGIAADLDDEDDAPAEPWDDEEVTPAALAVERTIAALWSEHLTHEIVTETSHRGTIVGARCVNCGVELPQPVRPSVLDPIEGGLIAVDDLPF